MDNGHVRRGDSLVPPFRGLPSLRGWGLLQVCNCIVLSLKLQTCNNPHRFAEPPERGHEGLPYENISIIFRRNMPSLSIPPRTGTRIC